MVERIGEIVLEMVGKMGEIVLEMVEMVEGLDRDDSKGPDRTAREETETVVGPFSADYAGKRDTLHTNVCY